MLRSEQILDCPIFNDPRHHVSFLKLQTFGALGARTDNMTMPTTRSQSLFIPDKTLFPRSANLQSTRWSLNNIEPENRAWQILEKEQKSLQCHHYGFQHFDNTDKGSLRVKYQETSIMIDGGNGFMETFGLL
jgi:hypothetical protein